MSFEKWIPIDNLAETLYLEAIHDDYEGFRLLLKGSVEEDKVLRITFDPALSYRNTDEGDLLKTINEQSFGGWSLYVASDSDYLKCFLRKATAYMKTKILFIMLFIHLMIAWIYYLLTLQKLSG